LRDAFAVAAPPFLQCSTTLHILAAFVTSTFSRLDDASKSSDHWRHAFAFAIVRCEKRM
jgi:hypothetical protein